MQKVECTECCAERNVFAAFVVCLLNKSPEQDRVNVPIGPRVVIRMFPDDNSHSLDMEVTPQCENGSMLYKL